MFIEISNSFAKLIFNNDKDVIHKNCQLINSVFDCMLQKEHIIYCNLDTISILEKCKSISPSSQYMIKWIKNKQNDLNAIKNMLSFTVVIEDIEESYYVDKKIHLAVNQYSSIEAACLISENDADYEFYMSLFNFFYNNNTYSVYLNDSPSYGGNINNAIERHARRDNFFLCITDSDKEYYEAAFGSTYKNAKKSFDKIKEVFPRKIYSLNVREKENLFPFNFYINLEDKQSKFISNIIKMASEEVFRYVKIKDGIKIKRIYENNEKWNSLYKDLISQCEKDNICQICNKDDDYYIKGINNNALAISSKEFFNSFNSYKKIEKSSLIEEIFGQQKFIIEEWKEIAHLIFDFGCCLSDQVNFIV